MSSSFLTRNTGDSRGPPRLSMNTDDCRDLPSSRRNRFSPGIRVDLTRFDSRKLLSDFKNSASSITRGTYWKDVKNVVIGTFEGRVYNSSLRDLYLGDHEKAKLRSMLSEGVPFYISFPKDESTLTFARYIKGTDLHEHVMFDHPEEIGVGSFSRVFRCKIASGAPGWFVSALCENLGDVALVPGVGTFVMKKLKLDPVIETAAIESNAGEEVFDQDQDERAPGFNQSSHVLAVIMEMKAHGTCSKRSDFIARFGGALFSDSTSICLLSEDCVCNLRTLSRSPAMPSNGHSGDAGEMKSVFTARLALHLMIPVFSGLQAVHDAGFMHLDVKEDNILITRHGVPKLTDFGCARMLSEKNVSGLIGTDFYMAPEFFSKKFSVTAKSDAFSAGMTLLLMSTGRYVIDKSFGYYTAQYKRSIGFKNIHLKLFQLSSRLLRSSKLGIDYVNLVAPLLRKVLVLPVAERTSLKSLLKEELNAKELGKWRRFSLSPMRVRMQEAKTEFDLCNAAVFKLLKSLT